MPKNSASVGKDGCLMPFHWVQQASMTSGVAGVIIYPTTFPRVLTEADAWDYFRVKSLKFRLLPNQVAPAGNIVVGYVPGVQDTPPTSQANVAELIYGTCLGGDQTTPTNWVKVPAKELAGPFPWYKTIPGTVDSTEEIPGAIYVAGTTTDPFLMELCGVFEFKSSIATNNTPAALALAREIRAARVRSAQERRRAEMLAVLGGSGATGVLATPAPTGVARP